MPTLFQHALLLFVFSASLGATISAFRDEEPRAILRGTVRRGLLFAATVAAFGLLGLLLESQFLRPDS